MHAWPAHPVVASDDRKRSGQNTRAKTRTSARPTAEGGNMPELWSMVAEESGRAQITAKLACSDNATPIPQLGL